MQAVQMKDLEVGQWGLFDPIYGPEKVLAIDTYALGPDERGARVFGTSIKSGTWEAVRFYVTNERTEGVVGRYVLRFPTEPVIAMTFDRRPSEVDLEMAEAGVTSEHSKQRGREQCAACPVFTGECPECGTFWWTRYGKRYGMRPVTERDAQAIRQLQQRNNTAGIVYLRELPNVVMP